VEVVKRLLGNLLSDPRNDKYRKVRLGNPRIKESVADRECGVDLLEAVGFRVADKGGELFAVMDEVPGDARLGWIRQAVLLLQRARPSTPPPKQADAKGTRPDGVGEQQGVKRPVDHQVRHVIHQLLVSVTSKIMCQSNQFNRVWLLLICLLYDFLNILVPNSVSASTWLG
jgi:UBX domain-containing protein 6